jgi:hypothetical protein
MSGERPSHEAGGDPGPRVHDVGPGGLVDIVVDAVDVRVRGIDGTEARVVAPADGAGLETRAQAGRFSIRTSRSVELDRSGWGGFLGIQIGSRSLGFPFRGRVSGTVEIEVPRDARVEVNAGAGDVAVRDVRGDLAVTTASGDVSVTRAAGRIAVEAASGDIHVAADQPVTVEIHTVSGDVEARAPRFERVAIETVSGDAELSGSFAPGVAHAVSTVSGDVEVNLDGGLTLDVTTVSGRIECTHPDRRDGDGRKRPLVIGDGVPRLAVRSMSGDVQVRAGRPIPADAEGGPVEPGPEAPGTDASAEPEEPGTLAVLEALARGEIDVAEAERLLASASVDLVGAAGEAPGG